MNMKPKEQILKRFAELEREIQGLQRSDGSENTAQWNSWATRVMRLLGDAFAVSSQYYKNFKKTHDSHYEFYGLDDAIGVFRGAKADYESGYVSRFKPSSQASGHAVKPPCVFIGHGRSKLWARLKIYLEGDLRLKTVCYESEPRAGNSIVPILEKMLKQATFAVLILTAEDETIDSKYRARQNVVHEAGLFQGRLSFERAILLVQDGLDDFSNVDGLQYIPFVGDNIEETFHELQRTLSREMQLGGPLKKKSV